MAYTPIFDSLFGIDDLNLTDAAVFGAVWRYAQGKLKKCIASPETIAEGIGLTHNPVRKALKKLCDLGLLTDLTPTVRYKAHEYIPTQKALNIIAKEAEVTRNRLPKNGNLDEVTQDDRLPENGNPGYQILKDRLPESGNEESINNDSIREEERARSHVHEDYLGTVVNSQGKVSEQSAPNPDDQWIEYRDEFLNIHVEMTKRWPDQAEKEIIVNLAGESGANPTIWRKSYVETSTNWGGNGRFTLARVVEVYRQGGDYEKWRQWKYPNPSNGRDSPGDIGKVEIRTAKTTGGGYDV